MFSRKQFVLTLLTFISVHFLAQNQPNQYSLLTAKANALFKDKDYKNSALTFSLAFKANGWKGASEDRYNAACAWALAGIIDSAFFQLDRIATKGSYADYYGIINDPDLNALHEDKRWEFLIRTVKHNKTIAEVNFNKPLVRALESVFNDDQNYRVKLEDVEKKYGFNSGEVKALWDTINEKDKANLILVKKILDQYGWLGPEVIGENGNATLFLVIQHADQATQEKYLPMMRDAVKHGKAYANALALLEDRVALGQGKKQIYGSQISMTGGKYSISPIEDEANVNKRRAAVGLEPLEEYVKQWGIIYKPGMSNLIADTSFWQRHNVIILLLITVMTLLLIVGLIVKIKSLLMISPWFWFYTLLFGFSIWGWYTDASRFIGGYAQSPVSGLLNSLTNAIAICLMTFAVEFGLSKLFKRKNMLVDLISIAITFLFFILVLAQFIHSVFFPGSSMVFLHNILVLLMTLLIPVSAFLIIRLILYFVFKLKKSK